MHNKTRLTSHYEFHDDFETFKKGIYKVKDY